MKLLLRMCIAIIRVVSVCVCVCECVSVYDNVHKAKNEEEREGVCAVSVCERVHDDLMRGLPPALFASISSGTK
jgi:hypothetical protein